MEESADNIKTSYVEEIACYYTKVNNKVEWVSKCQYSEIRHQNYCGENHHSYKVSACGSFIFRLNNPSANKKAVNNYIKW